jgi:trk system potassium uptake protein TrkA
MARKKYQVQRTIARINDPRNSWLFTQNFHVDVALNQSAILASLILEEMSMGDMMTLLKLRRGAYSLVEEKIPPGSKALGIPIQELKLPENCVIAAVIRDGNIIAPHGMTAFQVEDEVLAVTDPRGAEKLAALIAVKEG